MAYSESLAQRIRTVIPNREGMTEKKMFGGLAFLLNGKMCCGIQDDNLVVRIVADKYDEALREPHVRPMDFTGKPLKGFLYIEPAGYASDDQLKKWLQTGIEFVDTK